MTNYSDADPHLLEAVSPRGVVGRSSSRQMALRMLRSFIPVLYVRVSPERLVVTNVKNGESLSEVPEFAIARNPERVLACGAAARGGGY